MSALAVSDTDEYLWRHPWGTTERDNPVDLLRDLRVAYETLESERDDLRAELEETSEADPDRLALLTSQLGELVAFVRGLHDQQKISDVEWEIARDLARRIPEHRAQRTQASTHAADRGRGERRK